MTSGRRASSSGQVRAAISAGVRGQPRWSQSAATPMSAPAMNAEGTSCGMSSGAYNPNSFMLTANGQPYLTIPLLGENHHRTFYVC